MAGHSIKVGVETYAHIVLAAAAAGQTATQWMEDAAQVALARQDQAGRVAQYRQAQRRAAERLEGAPLARDFGLAPGQF